MAVCLKYTLCTFTTVVLVSAGKFKEITTTFMQIVSNFFVSRQRCNTLKRERQRSFIT